MLLNNEYVNSEMKKEIKMYLKKIKMKAQQPQIDGTQLKQF